jgi:prephenate dehydrogenase
MKYDELYQKLFVSAFQSLVGTESYLPQEITKMSHELASHSFESLTRIAISPNMITMIELDQEASKIDQAWLDKLKMKTS